LTTTFAARPARGLRKYQGEIMTTVIEKLNAMRESWASQLAALRLEPLLTTADLRALLRVDRRTITRLYKKGVLPRPLLLGGLNRWRPDEVAAAIDRLGVRADKTCAVVGEDK
jgi:predicted DNA-binding transcriptional regulator AlpA